MKLAYLGPQGTFGEMAALRFGPHMEHVPQPSHARVAAAVAEGAADLAVLPVENSVEGSVNETLDILIHDAQLQMCGEVIVPVEQCLLVRPGMRAEDVRVIYSHPQALGQCRAYVDRLFPDATLEASLSTAGAVAEVFRREGVAAIASARAGEVHGAEMLARGIQDRPHNVTRFVVLGHHDASPTDHDRTSMAFTTQHDRPGSLVQILSEFAERGLNLSKIESRPSKDALGVYIFFADVDCHRLDPDLADALERVREKAQWLKILGSYPRFREASE